MTSKIKVDNINKVSDDSNIIKKCGSTTTVGSGSGQTIVVDGATVTLGRCGGAVNLASGATQSGFGRTGTVDWCTTAKTSPFTAVSGDGFFVNTTSGAITVTLPASPSAGDIISLKDYANTWDTNSVTLCRNGSKINGVCANTSLVTESQSVTLIYVDGTKGWQDIQDSTSNVSGTAFIAATGGTITTSGDFKIHTFTADGCFAVSGLATDPANNKTSYMVVAGGGSSKSPIGAGGGAGGFREGKLSTDPYTASPLAATPCSALTLTVSTFPISVGAGGSAPGSNGSNSIFSTITSAGGGYGGNFPGGPSNSGGSGGGAGRDGSPGAGNTPSVSPPQGNSGGSSPPSVGFPQLGGGGGGGATAAGGGGSPGAGGAGGAGATTSITGTPTAFAGGGGGGTYTSSSGGTGGTGGGAPGGAHNACRDGTVNTGGGAGGCGGDGGSGIVVIRYKFQ